MGRWQTVRYGRCHLRGLVLAKRNTHTRTYLGTTPHTSSPVGSGRRSLSTPLLLRQRKGDPSMIFGQSIHPRHHDGLTGNGRRNGRPATHPREPSFARPLLSCNQSGAALTSFEPACEPSGFVSAVSVQDIGGWVSGLWRACHQAVLPFNRPVSRGHPSREVIKPPVLVRSELTVSLYWAPWAETFLALIHQSPSNLFVLPSESSHA